MEHWINITTLLLFAIVFLRKGFVFWRLSGILRKQKGNSRLAVALLEFFTSLSVQAFFIFSLYALSTNESWFELPTPQTPLAARISFRIVAIVWALYVINRGEQLMKVVKEEDL